MYLCGTRCMFGQGKRLDAGIRQAASALARARYQRSLRVICEARGRSWLEVPPSASLFPATNVHLQQIATFAQRQGHHRRHTLNVTQQWLTLMPKQSLVSYRTNKAELDTTSRPASGSLQISKKHFLLQARTPNAFCKRDKMKV